jgi:hypothetical protein
MQLHGSFQALRQGGSSVSTYMQQAKSLFDELADVGRPMSLEDFNLYVFCGLRGEFKDLITSLIIKAESISYANLYNHLLTNEFLHKNSLQSMDATVSLMPSFLLSQPPLLPTPQPSTHLAMSHHSSNFSRNMVVLEVIGIPTATTTVRLVFSIVVSCDLKIHQLDINNVFLNGVLHEEVYMKQPPGFVDSTLPSHVCRLHRSLYGLKQALRAWYTRLNDFLLSTGFCASKVDTSLFIFSVGADICYLLVYVDDILLMGSNSLLFQCLIQLLSAEFKLCDLGTVSYFLGVEVTPTGMGLML